MCRLGKRGGSEGLSDLKGLICFDSQYWTFSTTKGRRPLPEGCGNTKLKSHIFFFCESKSPLFEKISPVLEETCKFFLAHNPTAYHLKCLWTVHRRMFDNEVMKNWNLSSTSFVENLTENCWLCHIFLSWDRILNRAISKKLQQVCIERKIGINFYPDLRSANTAFCNMFALK